MPSFRQTGRQPDAGSYPESFTQFSHRRLSLLILTFILFQWFIPGAQASTGELHPLEPPDTSSPRATLQSYLETMQDAAETFSTLMTRYRQEPSLSFGPASQREFARLSTLLRRARPNFNLQQVAPRLNDKVGLDSILLLKEILDRIVLPPFDTIPDAQAVAASHLEKWRIPQTQIIIAKVKEGERAGEFLFSPDTIEMLPEFYEKIRALPYKPGSWEGVYDFYTTIGQYRFIPWKLTEALPTWAKTRVWEQALWRWIVLALAIVVAVAVLTGIYRWSRGREANRPILQYGRRLIMPISISAAAWLLGRLVVGVNVTGNAHYVISTALGGVLFLSAAWAILLVGNVVAEVIVSSPRIKKRSLDEAVARLSSKMLAFIIGIVVVLYGAHVLGLPVLPLMAGLGVGSLALALAAQPTIENFIAGLTLYVDRPARVGDFGRFGGMLGKVEEIGMRSTRIRTLDDTIISIPNSDFSKARLENFSARGKIWYHPRIRLHYETTPDQVRYVLLEIQSLLRAHSKCLPDPARVRFVEFGEYSMDLDVFAYIDTTDYGEFLGVAEDLNLRIMDVIAAAGTRLAIPAQIEYQAEERPLDKEARKEAESKVQVWKTKQSHHLSNAPPEKVVKREGS